MKSLDTSNKPSLLTWTAVFRRGGSDVSCGHDHAGLDEAEACLVRSVELDGGFISERDGEVCELAAGAATGYYWTYVRLPVGVTKRENARPPATATEAELSARREMREMETRFFGARRQAVGRALWAAPFRANQDAYREALEQYGTFAKSLSGEYPHDDLIATCAERAESLQHDDEI